VVEYGNTKVDCSKYSCYHNNNSGLCHYYRIEVDDGKVTCYGFSSGGKKNKRRK